jgi:guanylate kinase
MFVTEHHFRQMLSAGVLLEHTEVYGHRYGTPRLFVEQYLRQGTDVLLVLDVEGKRQLAASHASNLVSVFLLPPSMEDLTRDSTATTG